MRKMLFMALLCFVIVKAPAQQPATNPFPKTITVSGSAEMEVIPDQIYVYVSLKEYQKKGEDKKELEDIKADFLNACSASGIPDSMITIASYSGDNDYYQLRKKKKNIELYSSITYQVIFTSSKEMDALIDKLDDDATRGFLIYNTTHSKLTEYRRLLKIQAVKAAKEKAEYLTGAIGEKLNGAITIKEPDDKTSYNDFSGSNTRTLSNIKMSYNKAEEKEPNAEIEFKKIKLRFVVDVIFALQ